MSDALNQHARAADLFFEADERAKPDTVLKIAAFGLSIVEDVRAGRVRPMQSYEAFTNRFLVIQPDLNRVGRAFLSGIAIMVADAQGIVL